MKKHTNRALRQFFALLLCTAMLLPILPAPISVQAATVASAVTDAQSVVDQVRGLYSGGTMSNALEMDCGNGLTGNGEKSYMTIVTGTTATHFSNYQAKLKAAGYIVTCENTVASNSSKPNSFGSYTTADGSFKVYTYFLADYGETRIIVDTQSDTVEGYQYVPQTDVTVEPKLVLWGLSMASNGYNNGESRSRANIRNCGAMVIIRMPDNSLFINDGGDLE